MLSNSLSHRFSGHLFGTDAGDSDWKWHQLGHMQVCTSLQTDNHASIRPLSFFTGRMLFLSPNQQRQSTEGKIKVMLCILCEICCSWYLVSGLYHGRNDTWQRHVPRNRPYPLLSLLATTLQPPDFCMLLKCAYFSLCCHAHFLLLTLLCILARLLISSPFERSLFKL